MTSSDGNLTPWDITRDVCMARGTPAELQCRKFDVSAAQIQKYENSVTLDLVNLLTMLNWLTESVIQIHKISIQQESGWDNR